MNQTAKPPKVEVVASFLERLASLDPVLRVIISDAPLQVRFTVRGSTDRSMLFDFRSRPLRVLLDDRTFAPDVVVAMSAETWHDVLAGRLAPGEAFGRREMLLRGSAGHLARLIPLFDFAPMLYRDHIRRGACDITHHEHAKKVDMEPISLEGNRLHSIRKDTEKRVFRVMGQAAYTLGYCVEFARRRVVPDLSLFDLLAAMGRGVDDARRDPDPSQRQAGQ